MTIVVDASVVVAGLVDSGSAGRWAEQLLAREHLVAPQYMPAEAANILRRTALSGVISQDVASIAHTEMLELQTDLFPYEPFAGRVWQLRGNVTCYDGWYVALAETLGVALATLDRRLAAAPGPRCQFAVPPDF